MICVSKSETGTAETGGAIFDSKSLDRTGRSQKGLREKSEKAVE